MSKTETKTRVDPSGLRYTSKAPGSPFVGSGGAFQAGTMSCFLCGKHRSRANLQTKRLLGKAQFVCAPSCKELDQAKS